MWFSKPLQSKLCVTQQIFSCNVFNKGDPEMTCRQQAMEEEKILTANLSN